MEFIDVNSMTINDLLWNINFQNMFVLLSEIGVLSSYLIYMIDL